MGARIELSREIGYRSEFADLCNLRGVRVAVEVGTDLGVFARQFMDKFGGHELLCIDAYESYEWVRNDRTADIVMACIALMPWHGRVRIVRDNSVYAARRLPHWLTNRIDFVYIDASHDYASVQADLDVWWDVLRPGGLFAGHDYEKKEFLGVYQAVNEFAVKQDQTVYVVNKDPIPSWYMYKPK